MPEPKITVAWGAARVLMSWGRHNGGRECYSRELAAEQELRVYMRSDEDWLAGIAGAYDTRWPHVPFAEAGGTIQIALDRLWTRVIREHTRLTLLVRPICLETP